jgi:hypothetical protein
MLCKPDKKLPGNVNLIGDTRAYSGSFDTMLATWSLIDFTILPAQNQED